MGKWVVVFNTSPHDQIIVGPFDTFLNANEFAGQYLNHDWVIKEVVPGNIATNWLK